MAGTMPHAIFVETDVDGPGTSPPTPPSFPAVPSSATVTRRPRPRCPPRRVLRRLAARARREPRRPSIGDNWYEVERAAAQHGENGVRRAAFSLDELPPSDAEFAHGCAGWSWRAKTLADALDAAGSRTRWRGRRPGRGRAGRGHGGRDRRRPPMRRPRTTRWMRLYAARDLLTDALEQAGPAATACAARCAWRSPTICGWPTGCAGVEADRPSRPSACATPGSGWCPSRGAPRPARRCAPSRTECRAAATDPRPSSPATAPSGRC